MSEIVDLQSGEKCKPLKSVQQWMFYEKALKAVNTGGDLLL